MDKLNESPMLVCNYLISELRCDDNISNPSQTEKCYSGLLEEYGKVVCRKEMLSRILEMNACFVILSL